MAADICDKILAGVSGWTLCTVLPSWNTLSAYNQRAVAAANCYYSRIYRIWDKNTKYSNLITGLQQQFFRNLFGDSYPCLFQSWSGDSADNKKAKVTDCLTIVSIKIIGTHRIAKSLSNFHRPSQTIKLCTPTTNRVRVIS